MLCKRRRSIECGQRPLQEKINRRLCAARQAVNCACCIWYEICMLLLWLSNAVFDAAVACELVCTSTQAPLASGARMVSPWMTEKRGQRVRNASSLLTKSQEECENRKRINANILSRGNLRRLLLLGTATPPPRTQASRPDCEYLSSAHMLTAH